MTEQREAQREATETKRCEAGKSTDNPCPFVATERMPGWHDGPVLYCAYHVADYPLIDELNDYGIALEIIEESLKKARRHDNVLLIGDLERLKSDYQERSNFFGEVTRGIRSANDKVSVYREE